MVERVTGGAMESVDKLMMRWLQRGKTHCYKHYQITSCYQTSDIQQLDVS